MPVVGHKHHVLAVPEGQRQGRLDGGPQQVEVVVGSDVRMDSTGFGSNNSSA